MSRPGMVAVIQTFGSTINFHPHVHAIVSRGGWTSAGQWVPIAHVDPKAAEQLFRCSRCFAERGSSTSRESLCCCRGSTLDSRSTTRSLSNQTMPARPSGSCVNSCVPR